jgi:hypothetical protein
MIDFFLFLIFLLLYLGRDRFNDLLGASYYIFNGIFKYLFGLLIVLCLWDWLGIKDYINNFFIMFLFYSLGYLWYKNRLRK